MAKRTNDTSTSAEVLILSYQSHTFSNNKHRDAIKEPQDKDTKKLRLKLSRDDKAFMSSQSLFGTAL